MNFSHKAIEKKWQKYWAENNTFITTNKNDKKAYILDMFPYPSGSGLHVGHPRGYTATDIVARLRRMQGFDVLHPIGWDAFGLPAEQYALKTGNNPVDFTKKNIAIFKTQLQKLGFSFDYNKEIDTSNPNYYKITQWIFQKLFERGLAETREADVNWCPELGTVLANEEVLVVKGKMVSEVGGFEVIKRPMKQWVLKITNYAERLLDGLNNLDWPNSVKELQKNWIGKSKGLEIDFKIEKSSETLTIFTTRADTIFGVSYLVLAPEHPSVLKITTSENLQAVKEYIENTKTKTDIDRQDDSKPKTGVATGSFAINPITKEKIPVFIADYVLKDYGTSAVMAVPAHDPRDWDFATKYKLPIKFVQESPSLEKPFVGETVLINSDFLNNLSPKNALLKVTEFLISKKLAKEKVNYKLRDWLFSRQRFYGEPFPLLFLEDGSIALIPEDQLPVELPKVEYIKPSGNGESPLANVTDWVNIQFQGSKARRETNTMPQWAGSCWYYLAYIITTKPNNFLEIASDEAFELFKKWLPVDLYVGGQEHAVLHLLYARFWHQVLFDMGIVPYPEPFGKLINQGMILGENGEKMSKSKGNVINPDEIVESHGADTLRLYEMFMGPIDAALPWSFKGLDGSRKWLDRVYRLVTEKTITNNNNKELDFVYNETVAKVSKMIEDMKYNTAISQLMVFVNAAMKAQEIYKPYLEGFVKLLSPFTPHLAEELWEFLGNSKTITYETWPSWDENKLVQKNVTVAIQINGKLRATLEVLVGTTKEELLDKAKAEKNIYSYLQEHTLVKEIAVVDKIVNFVVK
ncbi:leucyl-tRNA synthetase [Spiroplasma sabaudiense Ar-1343]|uniref:Leucine--tRNA ligase n=1 Tax=Spiroplasma sabaudiense Ar-1343 TaxID=1276257 RepID=W6AAN1_9MOLU|nr:leucine--tRNA ligase [Spiroplasma sabaudiense]AHI54117.1 leucyl-tRNA synthetase [Spiroplasma sabaudiense Ar-1343]